MSVESHLVIRQVKSENGRPWQQRLVLKGLGLRGCGSQVTLLNQRAIRGMIRKVLHLVEVNGVEGGAGAQSGGAAEPKAAAKRAPRAAKGSKS
jgi:large subunit ribosomal protein L30